MDVLDGLLDRLDRLDWLDWCGGELAGDVPRSSMRCRIHWRVGRHRR
jgi:hypothetical protein